MLGWDLTRHFDRNWVRGPVVALERSELDVTSAPAVEAVFRKYQPAVVLNAAAYTNDDGAETERERAYEINVKGSANLAAICQEFSAKLVHFSTDQVFDGTSEVP